MVLSCQGSNGEVLRFALTQEVTRIGRGADNDILLFDEEAAERECELEIAPEGVIVRKCGSTRGVFVNGTVVEESLLLPGAILRLGETDFILEGEKVPTGSNWESANACSQHPGVLADCRCSKCRTLFCSACAIDGRKFGTPRVKFCPQCSAALEDLRAERSARRQAEEISQPLEAWKYPWRGEGAIILLTGAVFLALSNVAERFAMLLSIMVFVFTTGYLLAYSQKIITSSALGDYEPPTWPDFSDFSEDILPPFFQGIGLFVLYFLPFVLVRALWPSESAGREAISALLLLGTLSLAPMAWLGISMHDTIGALSPHLVVPSILRIPFAYLGVVGQLSAAVAFDYAASWLLQQWQIPFVSWLLGSLLSVYFLMVVSRLLGLLYFRNREQLGWF